MNAVFEKLLKKGTGILIPINLKVYKGNRQGVPWYTSYMYMTGVRLLGVSHWVFLLSILRPGFRPNSAKLPSRLRHVM